MKVLFAVGNDQLSKNIADKYYEKYGEVLEYKNVFFFKALIEEVKKNKTYDRIVINEEFEQYRATDLEQIDRKIFNYIDQITDEIQDADIIIICGNRRTRGDAFISKLFGIGIYNLLIGDDRNITPLCEILRRPKTKKEAKQDLKIDTSVISDSTLTRDDEVDEYQIRSILNYYDGIKNQPEKYVETFDRISEQYSRLQLMIIYNYLPASVKAAISEVERYKYLTTPPTALKQREESKPATPPAEATAATNNQNKKRGLFGFKKDKQNLNKPTPEQAMEALGQPGRVDLGKSNESINEEQLQPKYKPEPAEELAAQARAEAEARQQAELAARARAEAEARQQAELAERARAEAEARQKAEQAARAEAAAREQAELAARAKAEEEARRQAELEAKARAEVAAREQQAKAEEQAKLLEQARAEAAAREKQAQANDQAKLLEQAKAEAAAREKQAQANDQAKLLEQAKAEAAAREKQAQANDQAKLLEQAKAEAAAREKQNAATNVAGINIKPNPNAPISKDIEIDVAPLKKDPIVVEQKPIEPKPIDVKPAEPKPADPIMVEPKPVEPKPVGISSATKVTVTPPTPSQPISWSVPPVNNNVPTPEQLAEAKVVPSSISSAEQMRMKEEQEKLAKEQQKIREEQEKLAEEKRKLKEEQERLLSAQNQFKSIENTPSNIPQYTAGSVNTAKVPSGMFKKMVVFVGPNKAGTTFVTNAVAHAMASAKVMTSILDMTRDKGMWYIYSQQYSTAAQKKMADYMQRISDGEELYIETSNPYLKVYSSPGSITDIRRGYKHKNIIDVVRNNANVVLVDADFTTPIDYFEQASEIYIVQDLDILKMPDTTLFLRELKNRGMNMKKARVIFNKYVKTATLNPKKLVQVMSTYSDPAMTYMESDLLSTKVDYSIIPYNINNYTKYTEALCSGLTNYKGYSSDFLEVINEIVAKIYQDGGATRMPQLGQQKGMKKFFG